LNTIKGNDRLFVPLIAGLSVLVPALVALLLFADLGGKALVGELKFLPALNAGINSTVSVLLVAALVLVKRGKINLHRAVMLTALVLSIFFLVSYVLYHYAEGDVKYRGEGLIKGVYLFILISHILLSIAVVPLALFAVYRGLSGSIARHKKIVRWAWPIWFYVSVTGVCVYLFAHVFNPV
jgi:putative membrane protein